MVLEQTSKDFHTRVRFPRTQTLEKNTPSQPSTQKNGNLSKALAVSFLCSEWWRLREHRRIDGGLDDAGVDGQDGEDDTGQENQGQLVDVFDPDEHHRGHGGQQDGPVHAHVVQQRGLRLGSLQALQGKDGRLGDDVNLKRRRRGALFGGGGGGAFPVKVPRKSQRGRGRSGASCSGMLLIRHRSLTSLPVWGSKPADFGS